MTRLAILRPEPGASATAEAAAVMGFEPLLVPLFEVEALAWDAPDPARFDGLLITSANAIRHGGGGMESMRGLPIHAVGEASAEAATAAGFDVVTTGAAGVSALLATIDPSHRFLHLAGADRAPTPEDRNIEVIPVYRSRAIERPSGLETISGAIALVHSPRAGRRLAELSRQDAFDPSTIAIAAISERAAIAAGPGWRSVDSAETPTDAALLALAARLCNNEPRDQ